MSIRSAATAGGTASERPTAGSIVDGTAGDWRWQLRHAVSTADELSRWLDLGPEEREAIERAECHGLPLRVTPHLLSLCDPRDSHCAIRRQVVPSAAETTVAVGDCADPLGERKHEVAPRLVRRYPDRALLLVTDTCAVHCRFCTRAGWLATRRHPPTLRGLAPALQYLRRHAEVREVILSGGDPLTLGTDKLLRVVRAVRRIEHVETIRLATRMLGAVPARVTAHLVAALGVFHPIWVMTHFNHPRELGAEAARACRRLVDGGFPLMNQTVLLRGINDDPATLAALFRKLVRLRVRPYYLLQADPAVGTAHLRTPLATGVDIMTELQGRLSGVALPKLVVDTPGGMGKVPLCPESIVARREGRTTLRTFRGVEVDYVDPPTS